MMNEKLNEAKDNDVSIWDCGSPLYDSFELASFCHQLDRHLMLLPFSKGSRRLTFRNSNEPDEFNDKTRMTVDSSRRWRAKEEEIEKKKSKVGLKEICRAVTFWRK